jgi:hypothetical protein
MKVGTKIRMKYGFGKNPPGLRGVIMENDISLGTNVPGSYVKIKLENDEEIMILETSLEKDDE